MSSTFSQAGVARVESVIKLIAQTCVDNEKYFRDLDAVDGEGAFRIPLTRGSGDVIAEWDEYDRSDLGTFIQKVATTMSGRIGGTSGPIWGTAFLRAAISVKDKNDISPADVVAMLRSAVEGIMKRGGASLGDKTLLDALVPLTDAIEADLDKGLDGKAVAQHAAEVARAAAEETAKLEAHRGRASYTGERSIGSPDPGAIAMAVLAERIAETW